MQETPSERFIPVPAMHGLALDSEAVAGSALP